MSGIVLIDIFLYLLVHLLPGIGFFLLIGNLPKHVFIFLAGAWGVSAAWNLFCALILLYLGLFSGINLLLTASFPLFLALAFRWRNILLLKEPLKHLSFKSETIVCLLVAIAFGVLMFATPKWNFLISPNMDAGNYETYSNHFWKTGNLYWNLDEYFQKGIPWDWIRSHNTWVLNEDKGFAMPTYVYGYPVMLGIAKTYFGSPVVSWVVNAILGMLTAGLIAFVSISITKNRLLGVGLAFMVCITPMYYYYTKQIMSEMVALFGVMILIVSLYKYSDERKSSYLLIACAGLFLLLQVKLDTYTVPTFMIAGFVLAELSSKESRKVILHCKNGWAALGATTFLSASMIVMLQQTSYLNHFSLNFPHLPGLPFLFSYGLYAFAGFCLLPFFLYFSHRFLEGKNHVQTMLFFIIIGAFSFVWLVFIAWNMGVRPVGEDLATNHDAFNLIRLFTVSSPIGLLVFCVGLPLAVTRAEGIWKGFIFTLGIGMIFLLLKSSHSLPDIWWMRRYLIFLIPAIIIVFSLILLEIKIDGDKIKKYMLLSVLMLSVIGIQLIQMKSILKHEVNKNAWNALYRLQVVVPDNSLLIATEGSSVLRGTINTFRSLRKGPTLMNVERDDIFKSIEIYRHVNDIFIVSSYDLEKEVNDKNLSLVKSHYMYRGWVNSLDSLVMNPVQEKRTKYYLYKVVIGN